jgi:hypothetical protein
MGKSQIRKLFQNKIVVLLAITLLAGCTGSFAYNRLDWLIPWYVDGYVDLSSEQRSTLREQLSPLLQWHRQEELARYLQLLDRVDAELQHPVSEGQVENWIDELSQASERVEQTLLQVAIDFGAGISHEQMEEFVESLFSRQTELEEELLKRGKEEYSKEHTGHLEDLMKRVMGRLSKVQVQRLERAAQDMRRYDSVWLQDRRAWLEQLQVLLQRKSGWREQLMQAYRDRLNNRSAEYTEIVEHNIEVVAAALAEVLNTRTDKQKAHTRREFEDMRAMLQKLIDQSGDQA